MVEQNRIGKRLSKEGDTFGILKTLAQSGQTNSNSGIDATVVLNVLSGLRVDSITFIRAYTNEQVSDILSNGTADLYCNSKVASDVKRFRHTIPVAEDRPVFIIRDSLSTILEHNLLFSLLNWSVWVFWLVFVVLLLVVNRVSRRNRFLRKSYHICNQSFIFLTTITLGVYVNFLAISLSKHPVRTSPFGDLVDLADKLFNKECRLVLSQSLLTDGPIYRLINPPLKSTVNSEKTRHQLRDAFVKNPPIFVKNSADFVNQVKSHTCYIGVDFYQSWVILRSRYCGLRAVEDHTVPKRQFVYQFSRHWKLGNEFNSELGRGSIEEAYLRSIWKASNYSPVVCTELTDEHLVRPLSLNQLGDAFLFWTSALSAALVYLIFECSISKKRHQTKMVLDIKTSLGLHILPALANTRHGPVRRQIVGILRRRKRRSISQ